MTAAQVQRVFDLLGLGKQSAERLNTIAKDGRTAAQIRDDLLAWGKKQGGSTYDNMLKSYVQQTATGAGLTFDDARIARIAGEIASGSRKIDEVRTTIIDLGKKQAATAPGSGQLGTPGGVLAGGQTIRVGNNYYQIYEFPPGSGSFVSYQFNNLKQAETVLGKGFDVKTQTQAWFDQRVLARGAAEEVVGKPGAWTTLAQSVMGQAAMAAGIRDPALAGRMANNKEMQQIMAQAIIGNWTPEQIIAEQRRTKFWEELYPGIGNLYGQTADPERAWAEYRNSVSGALSALGYQRDADGTFNSHIGRMLNMKIDSETFLSQVPVFIQATQNAEFAAQLSRWTQKELGKNLTFGNWFGLLAGQSQPDIEAVAEKAQLAWVAQTQGVGVTDAQISKLADRTQMSLQEAQRAFSDFAQGVLAVGEAGLQRYGLTRDDVLSAAAGVTGAGGRSVEETKLQIAKVARENALFDEDKINFFIGFSNQGTPERPGLQALSPERG